ncbi:amidase domain-containing protein [Treponema pedis]|uniref:Amidase domain-containing protein n=2 Tax=Treponema pedis TaxID=409322 RepID=A0A7S6WNV5_9SPIR|nr:amidase domain-containing protein [Treponema pedis]AGT42528.1 hypothetical protein TPE_0025 [Treponema pedis str. T A4]QOW60537.1 amidase domain-containing protein [Treponema pedis]
MKKKKKTGRLKLTFILFIAFLWIVAVFQIYSVINKHKKIDGGLSGDDENSTPSPLKRNTAEELFFINFMQDLYSEHYDIQNVYVYDYIPDDEDIEYDGSSKYYFVTIEKKLKYGSVFQLPFVIGMEQAVNKLNGIKEAKRIYNKRITELKKYIGLPQIENNIFKVVFSEENNFENAKVKIATYHSEISAMRLKPLSDSEMIKDGYGFIISYISNMRDKIEYDNTAAVKYADKYTSNPLNKAKNENVWNQKYKKYENDCANFVSQCIYAGGIQPTKTWFPESFYWIRTGSPKYHDISGLTTYMQKKNIFSQTNYSGLSAGGFICLIKESHVVFVTSNDSITVLFNGHTNDRKRVSFPHLNESEAMYLTPNN